VIGAMREGIAIDDEERALHGSRQAFNTELASGLGRTAMGENGGAVCGLWRRGPNRINLGLRSFEVASFHGGVAVPVTEFDPRRLKGIALRRPRQRGARMVETE
jgi:hypothetical protein